MNNKIRVAFIYKKNYAFLSGTHFDNTTYHFFMNALRRNKNLEMTYFPSNNTFDVNQLKGKFDAILLPNNNTDGTPDELIGISDVGIPVLCRTGDPHSAKRHNQYIFHEKWKIDYYFNFIPQSYFYKFYPKHYKYETVVFGLEPSLYQNIRTFQDRIKKKILNSGAVANKKRLSRIITRMIHGDSSSAWDHYKLRTLCNQLPYVDYTSTLDHKYVNDNYAELLMKYAAAIAATTNFPTIKYWEIPAAGCVTFMEITERNNGAHLGFIDGQTSIFINEQNYKKKFEEYLDDLQNPKWEEIANNGRKYVMENLNNDKAAESLAKIMESLL